MLLVPSGMGIHSYYPPQLNPILSAAFTRNVYGRKKTTASTCNLSIMRTSAIVPKTPKEFRVNHFVPLVQKESCVTITPVNLSCNVDTESPISEKSADRQFSDISELEVSPGLQSATGIEYDVPLVISRPPPLYLCDLNFDIF